MSQNKPIQLGLCCLNITLKSQKPAIYPSRRMIIRTIKEQGIDELKRRIILNLQDTLQMMDWNEANGIKVFRLSSDLFPHKTNAKIEAYSFDFAHDLLKAIGEKSRQLNQRITFHPSHFNVLGTPNASALENTINDLTYHAEMLDLMGLDKNSVMVIHGGGTYGNKSATIDRWCQNYRLLPENIQKRLVLENCEKNFSIVDCLQISHRLQIPVVFDIFHHYCYQKLHPDSGLAEPSEYIQAVLDSWKFRSIKPKFHVSEQGSGRVGHHSDYISKLPEFLLEIPEKYGVAIDIMIEAKSKELAIFDLYKKHPELNCLIIN